MSRVTLNEQYLQDTADAIRAKTGETSTYTPAQFATAIGNISGGDGYTIDDIAEQNMMSGSIYGSSASFIAEWAFYYCTKLTTASFPAVTSIRGYAFNNCNGLTEVSFPAATTIGSNAFGGCNKLTTASFPAVTSIGSNAFNNCYSLAEVSFPVATSIGGNAFSWCSRLTEVSFPAVTSIGNGVFQYCSSLIAASFPAATSIGSNAFQRCYHLISLYLRDVPLVPKLGNNAFNSTPIGGYTTSTGGVYGSVFVPASLYESFLTATNWSSISARIVSV